MVAKSQQIHLIVMYDSYLFYENNNFQAQQSTVESIVNKRPIDDQDLFGNIDDIDFEDEECKFLIIIFILLSKKLLPKHLYKLILFYYNIL